ncbi:phage tail protein [Lactobacillus reuteri]|uniref:phage tail protein n=1 Tax=Limosilactobacillus reuteri TaxID=1598 RepID=UPI00146E415A|nr:phage tail protein [Limosilactobacillus reuteri]NMV51612.1 phage tail protein [Limosilactobacillus reuteri]NMV55809.1 phage tail protein [Limosilactobacillus reuteri]NMV64769.1 phage tail protein [Limosilactobacillus reuteri]
MAGFTASDANIDPNSMNLADKIIYGCKFPWDKKEDLIHLLGLQAATSTTDSLATSAVNLKGGSVHAPGATTETFVVDSYWRKGDTYIQRSLRRCVHEKVHVGIFRFDFNQMIKDPKDPTKFVVPGLYGQAYPNGVPQTEAVNNLLHSNITYNIDGETQEGVTSQDEMEPALYQIGLKLYTYAHNTDIGGTMEPIADPLDAYKGTNSQNTNPALSK